MSNGGINIKNQLQIIMVSACVLVIVLLFAAQEKLHVDYLTDVSFSNFDGKIQLVWDVPLFSRVSEVKINISSTTESFSERVSPLKKEYEFTDGEHGTLYNISLHEIHKDGSIGKIYEENVMFLNYVQLPDLPTVYIYTETGEEPTNDIAEKPSEWLWGASPINNEYVSGDMMFVRDGLETVSSKMELRIRGNTSTLGDKKSYKLRLDSSVDVLNLGEEHADTEWILLNVGNRLNNYVGEYLSEVCGMEWVAHGMFVNVMLNGDWKGMYYLSEAVNKEQAGDNVSETGFVFENDAYWWKPDVAYFKVSTQVYQLGFTFKYPKLSNPNDTRLESLKWYMEAVTGMLTSWDEEALDYIDADTFAAWIMVRDIMHSGDAGGSNMYYYIYDLNGADYAANKLKMGPVWDYDAGMQGAENWHEDMTGWSANHDQTITYFPYLFDMSAFRAVYKEKWERVSEELNRNYDAYMEKLLLSQGLEINESRKLDSVRWGSKMMTIEEEIAYNSDFIRQRIEWINSAVEEW